VFAILFQMAHNLLSEIHSLIGIAINDYLCSCFSHVALPWRHWWRTY
jgi:hypothetical protein